MSSPLPTSPDRGGHPGTWPAYRATKIVGRFICAEQRLIVDVEELMMNQELKNRSFPFREGVGEWGRITWTVIINQMIIM
jgi:hypothetical protein